MALGFGYLVLVLLVMISSYTASFATADSAKDREECTQQLVGMATCLPYVGGQAKAPTPDCCSGLKQVLNNNKKCLCVIIKDRNDPELGLQMNVTLALGLPSVCKAPANVSKCPGTYNFCIWILNHQKLKFSINWKATLLKLAAVLLQVLAWMGRRVPKVWGQVLAVALPDRILSVCYGGTKWL